MDASGNQDGFILKFNGDQLSGTSLMEADALSSIGWSQTIGSSGNMDGFNNVVSSSNALYASGFVYTSAGNIDRYLVKYDLNTGSKIWEVSLVDPNNGRDGAYESMLLTADGGMVLTGVMNAESGSLEGFKSYGNPSSGAAFLEYFSAAQLNSSGGPQSADWLTMLSGANSGKGVRELPSGGFVVAALDADEGPGHAFRLSASGDIVWSNQYPDHGEITDVTLLTENGSAVGIALVGHTWVDGGGIDGSITRLNLDGTMLWHKTVGDPIGGIGAFAGLGSGNPKLIFDECWGIQGTSDGGMVLACGTGIEGCDEYSTGSAIHSECIADPRTTWRGYLVKLDTNGNEVWHRVDSFLEPGEQEAADAASEYVALQDNGAVVSIVDQGFGIGVLVLTPDGGNTPGDPNSGGETTDPGGGADHTDSDNNTDSGDESDEDDETTGLDGDGDTGENQETSEESGSGCSALGGPKNGYSFSWLLTCLLALAFLRRQKGLLPG